MVKVTVPKKKKGTEPTKPPKKTAPSDPPTRADRFTWYPGDVIVDGHQT